MTLCLITLPWRRVCAARSARAAPRVGVLDDRLVVECGAQRTTLSSAAALVVLAARDGSRWRLHRLGPGEPEASYLATSRPEVRHLPGGWRVVHWTDGRADATAWLPPETPLTIMPVRVCLDNGRDGR